MRKTAYWLLLILMITFTQARIWSKEILTYPDLVQRITNLEHLAQLPPKEERCLQWSSYDRASKYENGHYLHWNANADNDGCLRMEDGQMVMGEMDGPGCIWRIWSAAPGQGHVKIYLDGSPTPAIDLPFIEYFNGTQTPFNYSELIHIVARGYNCYVPIPFQKSCKIVADPNWGSYYHFTYSIFAPETEVPTFTRQLDSLDFLALMQANETLRKSGTRPGHYPQLESIAKVNLNLKAGETMDVVHLTGPRAIIGIRGKIKLPEDEELARNLLREIVIKITWDDDLEPAVWVPFGDFFGTAPGANPYRSFPCGLNGDEWYAYWYMPFAKTAHIEVINESTQPQVLFLQVEHVPFPGAIENYGRFHAKWHRDSFPAKEPERAAIDWSLLHTQGSGRFCGVMLHVWNPKGSWWGEGDEKFYVDGETFPSTFGTGSEDYFGYAWCDPTLFQNAFHNQTISMGNKGHISVNRWHISDNIPFQTSFDASIEKYFPNERPTLYAATVYWYLSPGGIDPYPTIPVENRIGYWYPIRIYQVPNAIEGESMRILSHTGGTYSVQDMSNFTDGQWSKDAQLWWRDSSIGNKLTLEFTVLERARYSLQMTFTQAKDYGIFQIWLDNKKIGSPLDLYNPTVISSGKIDFGTRLFRKGTHQISIECLGKNKNALPNQMFGLDYILLSPTP